MYKRQLRAGDVDAHLGVGGDPAGQPAVDGLGQLGEGVGEGRELLGGLGGEALLAQRLAEPVGVGARLGVHHRARHGEAVEVRVAEGVGAARVLAPARRERLVEGEREQVAAAVGGAERPAPAGVDGEGGGPADDVARVGREHVQDQPGPLLVAPPDRDVGAHQHLTALRATVRAALRADRAGEAVDDGQLDAVHGERAEVGGLVGPGVVERVERRRPGDHGVPAAVQRVHREHRRLAGHRPGREADVRGGEGHAWLRAGEGEGGPNRTNSATRTGARATATGPARRGPCSIVPEVRGRAREGDGVSRGSAA